MARRPYVFLIEGFSLYQTNTILFAFITIIVDFAIVSLNIGCFAYFFKVNSFNWFI